MTESRDVIAKNISALRTDAGMTQAALADVLNYSDKAVSKWERAESVPDVFMLKRIAEYFGVTVDYLLETDHPQIPERAPVRVKGQRSGRNKVIISLLAGCCCWFVATVAFVLLVILGVDFPAWLSFIYALPAFCIVNLVFNSIWGRAKMNYPIISVLMWTLILSLFLTASLVFGNNGFWVLFLVGIPGQIGIIIWSLFTKRQK